MIYQEKWGTKKVARKSGRKNVQLAGVKRVVELLEKVMKGGKT